MATCLDDLIGDDNGCATRAGRLYLKDVGITEAFLGTIIKKEDAGTAAFMADRRRFCAEYVTNDVITHLGRNLTGRTFIDAARLGKYPDTEMLVNGDASYLHGMVLEVCTPGSNTRILLSKIQFYGETTGDVVVTIYDMADGTEIETYTITAVAGQMASLDIDLAISCGREKKRLLIVTDQDIYYKSTLFDSGCAACIRQHNSNNILRSYQYMIDPVDKKIWANLIPATDVGGLSVIASVQCDYLGWLCEVKAALALPLLYCYGREIYTIALYNMERYGMKDLRKQDIEARRDEFEAHYAKSMEDLFANMQLPNDGLCFICDSKITSGIILP